MEVVMPELNQVQCGDCGRAAKVKRYNGEFYVFCACKRPIDSVFSANEASQLLGIEVPMLRQVSSELLVSDAPI